MVFQNIISEKKEKRIQKRSHFNVEGGIQKRSHFNVEGGIQKRPHFNVEGDIQACKENINTYHIDSFEPISFLDENVLSSYMKDDNIRTQNISKYIRKNGCDTCGCGRCMCD